MNEWKKTIGFMVASVVVIGLAFGTSYWNKPQPPKEFEKVGELFYDDFDPAEATLLEVTAIPEGSTTAKSFRVEFKDGMWRIPTHHGYPAEAKERLAETASSLIGIVREALAGRRENNYDKFSVNDPTASGVKDPKTVGQKISLKNANGDVLAEYIIGNRADNKTGDEPPSGVRLLDENKEKPLYYVRKANETETYKARLDVKISTKFADWIEEDLLKVDDANFQDLTTTKHVFNMVNQGGRIGMALDPTKTEINHLTKKGFDPWNLDGLDPKREELNTVDVDSIVSGLKDLKIVGVRPKPKYNGNPILTADFKINVPENANRREFQDALMNFSVEMRDKGFHLDQPENKDPLQTKLISQNGEIVAATDEGLVYRLYFGDVVVGNEKEIEIGSTTTTKGDANKSAKKKSAKSNTDDETVKTNRYLYLNVTFDEQFITDDRPAKPQMPVEPKKPETPIKKKTDTKTPKKSTKKAGKKDTDRRIEIEFVSFGQDLKTSPNKQKKQKKELTPQQKYELAITQYRTEMQQYSADLQLYKTSDQEYQDKIAKGKKKTAELSDRFEDWFYVISAESLKDLRVSRKSLVKRIPLIAPRPESLKNIPLVAPRPASLKTTPKNSKQDSGA